MKSDTKQIEIREHKAITYGLVAKGLVEDDKDGFLKTTLKGQSEVIRICDPITLEEIALILISFCENERIPYHIINGVVRPVNV